MLRQIRCNGFPCVGFEISALDGRLYLMHIQGIISSDMSAGISIDRYFYHSPLNCNGDRLQLPLYRIVS